MPRIPNIGRPSIGRTIGRSAAMLLATALVATACSQRPSLDLPSINVPALNVRVTDPLTAQPAPLDTLPDLGISLLIEPSDRAAATSARAAALGPRRASEQALWRNVQTGNSGYVTPLDIYEDGRGRQCRRLQHVFSVNGAGESADRQANGTACRQADGVWIAVAE